MDALQAAEAVEQQGFARLRLGPSRTALESFVETVASRRTGTFWGATQDMLYDPQQQVADRQSIAYGAGDLPAHTDGSFETSPPRYLFLQCVEGDITGFGETFVIDGSTVVARLDTADRLTLAQPLFTFRRERDGRATEVTAPIVTRAEFGWTVRYRHDASYRIEPASSVAAAARKHFEIAARASTSVSGPALRVGEVFWIDNARVMHGRTALSGQSRRWVRACWADPTDRRQEYPR